MASKQSRNWVLVVASGVALGALWLCLSAAGVDQLLGLRGIEWVWLPPILGMALGFLGFSRGVIVAAAGGMGLLIVIGWLPPIGRLAQRYVRNDKMPSTRPDAVIVLSAAVTSDGGLSPPAVDRLLAGIDLLDSVATPRLIVSRVWNGVGGRRPVNSDLDQRNIVEAFRRPVELHLIDSVGSTRLEAERAKSLFDRRGWHSAIVVTSPVHTRRACATFERIGIEVVCRASLDRETAIRRPDSAADRIEAFGQWLYETLGWWKYRFRGWVGPDEATK